MKLDIDLLKKTAWCAYQKSCRKLYRNNFWNHARVLKRKFKMIMSKKGRTEIVQKYSLQLFERYQTFRTLHLGFSSRSFHQRRRPLGTNLHDISFRVLTSFCWILHLSRIRLLPSCPLPYITITNEMRKLNVLVLRQIKIFIETREWQ